MNEERALLRGFLYQNDGQWILADQPNLKSCCLSQAHGVTLVGDFSAYTSDKPITVEGVWLQKNMLAEVVVVEDKQEVLPYITLGVTVGLGIILTLIFRKRK